MAFFKLVDWQQRVVDERNELHERIVKLRDFFDNPLFTSVEDEEKRRLRRQVVFMEEYRAVLDERISHFKDCT